MSGKIRFVLTKALLRLDAKLADLRLRAGSGFVRKVLCLARTTFKGQTSFYPPLVLAFEEDFARYCGTRHAVSFCNGTSAIEAALFAVGLLPGDEVLVPSCTFHASIDPILNLGAKPVFVDVDPKSFTMPAEDAEKKVTERTRCLLVVHVWGTPADMDALNEVARRHDLKVVEDASHAHGARWKGRRVGALGHVGCFSLQASKPVAAGEGGMAVTDDDELKQRLLLFGHYGRDGKKLRGTRYAALSTTGMGHKRRMHPLGVCLAAVDLRRNDKANEAKKRWAARLAEAVRDVDGLDVIHPPEGAEPGGFAQGMPLIIREPGDPWLAGRFTRMLNLAGINAVRYTFLRHHLLPHYLDLDYRRGVLHDLRRDPPEPKAAPPPLPQTEHAEHNVVLIPFQFLSPGAAGRMRRALLWAWDAARDPGDVAVPSPLRGPARSVLDSDAATALTRALFRNKVDRFYARRYGRPRILYFSCTNICNARCVFCVYRKLKPEPRTMDMDTFQELASKFQALGGRQVGLTPTIGDPLLDRFLVERLRLLDDLGMESARMYTNLIGLTAEHLDCLAGLKNLRVKIFVSITGFNREDYARFMGVDRFDTVMDNLARLSRTDNVDIRVVLRNYGVKNWRETDLYRFLAQQTALPERCRAEEEFLSVQDEFRNWGGEISDRELDDLELKKARLRKRCGPCAIMYEKNKVSEDGEYLLCEPHDYKKLLHVGSARDMDKDEHWRAVDAFRNALAQGAELPESCRNCTLYRPIYSPANLLQARRGED